MTVIGFRLPPFRGRMLKHARVQNNHNLEPTLNISHTEIDFMFKK